MISVNSEQAIQRLASPPNPYGPGFSVFDSFRTINRALPTVAVDHGTDLSTLTYPCIFKPAKCSTNSSQVRLIASPAEARAYLIETMEQVVCAQRFHPGEEYTIMYERWPWRSAGEVKEMYNMLFYPRARLHPRVLLERLRAFRKCGGWDFRICDGY